MSAQRITILGRPISKKNSKQFVVVGGRRYIVPSKAYTAFKKDVASQMLQYKRMRLKGPLHIDYIFYLKGRIQQDVDNAMASINDLLQDYNIIEDDKDIERGSFERHHNCREWKTEVIIKYE